MQTVTQTYLDVIIEARQLHNGATANELEQHVANLNGCIKRHSGLMKDFFKGQRDWCKNRLKRVG